MASAGQAPYTTPAKNIQPLARLIRIDYAFVVRGDSGLETVADLKGKDVVVGIKSNLVLEKVNEVMLATAGLTPADVTSSDAGGLSQGLDSVIEGRAVASAIALGIPALRQADASTPGGIKVLALGDDATTAFTTERVPGAIVSQDAAVRQQCRRRCADQRHRAGAFSQRGAVGRRGGWLHHRQDPLRQLGDLADGGPGPRTFRA